MNAIHRNLPDKLRQLRQLCGFSQEFTAASWAMSQTALSRLEAGKSKLTVEHIDLAAQFYKLSITELLYEDLPALAHKLIDRRVILIKSEEGKMPNSFPIN